MKKNKPRVGIFDIETMYMIVSAWQGRDNFIPYESIIEDWTIASFAGKYLGEKTIYQKDQSKIHNIRNDRILAKFGKEFVESCHYIISQNGKKFDIPKLNARYAQLGLKIDLSKQPKHIDVYRVAKRHLGFTFHSLEAMANYFGVKIKKLTDRRFPGKKLWDECRKGNQAAWKEMAKYNIRDILVLEQIFLKMQKLGWIEPLTIIDENCKECGAHSWRKNGFRYNGGKKWQRLVCNACGNPHKVKL